jgi:nucleoside-diphosphate-sugar epimerase
MNVLVTGGYGHIGIYLVRRLLEAGDTVVVFDQSSTPNPIPYPFDPKAYPKLTAVAGDVRDLDTLEATCKAHNIDHIAHMSAMLAAESKLDPMKSIGVNCMGAANVFEVARHLSLKRVVWPSSISVYGSQSQYGDKPLPNDAPHYPRDLYGVCKSFSERLAAIYSSQYGLNIVAIRFPQGYGFGRTRGGGIWTVDLFVNSVAGRPVVIPNGDDRHNFILVEDEADVVFTALKAEKIASGAYNMSGEVASKKDALAYVKELVPAVDVTLSPGNHNPTYLYDDSALRQQLGWKPKHTLKEGIKKTVDFAKQHGAYR